MFNVNAKREYLYIYFFRAKLRPDKHGRVFLVSLKNLNYCTGVQCTKSPFKGTRNTRSCKTGHPVDYFVCVFNDQ